MYRKVLHQVLSICFTIAILAVCVTPAVAVSLESIENSVVVVTPTAVLSQVKTVTPIPTEENRWRRKVEWIGDLRDLSGKWANGKKVLEIQVISQVDLDWGMGVVRIHGLPTPGTFGFNFDCDAVEWFQFDSGFLTWGDPSFPCASRSGWTTWGYEQDWIDNPQATYEVFIIQEGDQPYALRFRPVNRGEDLILVRQEYLTGGNFKWIGDLSP
ncbi:MAG: hypothetical protein JSV42_04675 [Chloroflexota bacterium]|nr:MAG: hypothetical protein JSV42_04675 [Chloroflexota bacterium]